MVDWDKFKKWTDYMIIQCYLNTQLHISIDYYCSTTNDYTKVKNEVRQTRICGMVGDNPHKILSFEEWLLDTNWPK